MRLSLRLMKLLDDIVVLSTIFGKRVIIFHAYNDMFLNEWWVANYESLLPSSWSITLTLRDGSAFVGYEKSNCGAEARGYLFTYCTELVKMMSFSSEWPVFMTYLEEIKRSKSFLLFSISLISKRANCKADKLARSAFVHPHIIMYVNNVPSYWIFWFSFYF